MVFERQHGANGSYDGSPTVSITGIVRLVVPTEPSNDPSDDLTRWVIQRGNTVIPIDDKLTQKLIPGQVIRASFNPEGGAQHLVSAASVQRPYSPIPDRHLLVVPVQWNERPMSKARLAAATNTQTELASWWRSASSGIETLTVRQAPVLQVTLGQECDDFGAEEQVAAWVAASEYASWVTNTALLWPENSGCTYGGLGYMPGYFTWMNKTTPAVWAHELGHNMGLPHANSCTMNYANTLLSGKVNLRPSYLSKCQHVEYGNYLDVMGFSDLSNGYNVDYLNRIGWLGNSQVATWDGLSRTYQLARSNDMTGLIRGIKIPSVKMLGSLDEGDFWIQFKPKQQAPYQDVGSGVFIMMKPSMDYLQGLEFDDATRALAFGSTWLCNISMTKDVDRQYPGWVSTSYLESGVPLDDRLGRFRITLISSDSDTATIRVEPGPTQKVATATNVRTTILTDETGLATGSVKIEWSASTPADLTTLEPSVWTATLSPGSSSCSVSVFARTCSVNRVPRGQPLSVVVTGAAPVGTSVSNALSVEPIPNSPPLVSADYTVGQTTAEIRPRVIDDGGLPVTSIVVTQVDGPSCDATTSNCTFSKLMANHRTGFVVEASNASGKRLTKVEITTQPRVPDAPVGFITLNGSTETVTIDASPLDRFNVSNITFICFRKDKNGVSERTRFSDPIPYAGIPIEKVFDASIWKIYRCDAYAISSKGRGVSVSGAIFPGRTQPENPGPNSSDVTPTPVPNPITISIRAERFAPGRYVVRWNARSRDGKTVRVTVPKFGSRKCTTRTRNSCVVVGLRSGKLYTVTFTARTSSATKKRKFSIRVP